MNIENHIDGNTLYNIAKNILNYKEFIVLEGRFMYNIKQRELASELNVSYQYIQILERKAIVKLCNYLHID